MAAFWRRNHHLAATEACDAHCLKIEPQYPLVNTTRLRAGSTPFAIAAARMAFAHARPSLLTEGHGGHRRWTVKTEPKSQDRDIALSLHLAQCLSQEAALEVSERVNALGSLSPWV